MTYIPIRQAAGSDKQVQYNDGGVVLGAESALAYDKSTNQLTPGDSLLMGQIANPSTPATGKNVLFAAQRGMVLPAWINEAGTLNLVQPAFARRHIFEWLCEVISTGAGSTTSIWRGGGTFSSTSNANSSTVARATTNIHTKIPGIFRLTSATADNSLSETHGTYQFALSDNGMFVSIRFAVNATPTNLKYFYGMHTNIVVPAATVDPISTSFTSCFGIGCTAAGTTLQIITNDATGSSTGTDLLSNFPSRDTATVYDAFFYLAPGGATLDYYVVNLGSGNTTSGQINTNLPPSGSFMCPIMWMTNGGSAGGTACVSDVARFYLEVLDV